MAYNGIAFIPTFMQISQLVLKLKEGTHTNRMTITYTYLLFL